MLRSHGEDELAERAPFLTDDELTRIGTLGAYYAFSEQAMALSGSMGGTRALSLATIGVLENTGRDLRWSRTRREREMGWSDEVAEADAARDRALRVHAIPDQQPPSDQTPDPAAELLPRDRFHPRQSRDGLSFGDVGRVRQRRRGRLPVR